MPIYNPPPVSTSGSAVPQIVANGVTYTVPDNTQVAYAIQIVAQAGGIVLTTGTGALVWIK